MIAGEDYWLDNYGTCKNHAKQCQCLQIGPWLGQGCLDWIPLGVKSFEELKEHIIESKHR